MQAVASAAVSEVLLQCLESGDFEVLRSYLGPATLFDATVPGWRFQLEGPEAIVHQLQHWWPAPARVTERRVTPTSQGLVVEFERRWEDDSEQVGCRQVQVLRLEYGLIAEMRVTCAGVWGEHTWRELDEEAASFRP